MIDQATNADGDSGRFKILNDWEHDDPEQAPSFKRDQQLTPAALFKAKVLAVLERERSDYEMERDVDGRIVCEILIEKIEAIKP